MARPKYKALLQEALRLNERIEKDRLWAEKRLAALRGHVNRLVPDGKRVALSLEYSKWPGRPSYKLPACEWLAFAVFSESIARDEWTVQTFEEPDARLFLERSRPGSLTYCGIPVEIEE